MQSKPQLSSNISVNIKSNKNSCPTLLVSSEDRGFLELFSGQGEVTRALRMVSWWRRPVFGDKSC